MTMFFILQIALLGAQFLGGAQAFVVGPPSSTTTFRHHHRLHDIARLDAAPSQGWRLPSPRQRRQRRQRHSLAMSISEASTPRWKRIPSELENIPIPFVDKEGNSFIECFADFIAVVNGVEYTVGQPCDNAVAICCYDETGILVPVEVNDDLMDDVFTVAETLVADEFGEELVLQRTPQTLTLVGELEIDNDEEFEEDDDLSVEEEEDDYHENVEVLLSFEHRGKDFMLVILLDPILLVGKTDVEVPGNKLLLTEQESDAVMPVLEEIVLEMNDDESSQVRP